MSSISDHTPDRQSTDFDDRDLGVRFATGLSGVTTRRITLATTIDQLDHWLRHLIDAAGYGDDEFAALFPPISAENSTYAIGSVIAWETHDPKKNASERFGFPAPRVNEVLWYLDARIEEKSPPAWMDGQELSPGETFLGASRPYMACRIAAMPSINDRLPVRLDYVDEVEPWIVALVSRAEESLGAASEITAPRPVGCDWCLAWQNDCEAVTRDRGRKATIEDVAHRRGVDLEALKKSRNRHMAKNDHKTGRKLPRDFAVPLTN
ncbi:MAG: hypothetical protein AB7R89_30960 [Dehalococcoidia bacterium]